MKTKLTLAALTLCLVLSAQKKWYHLYRTSSNGGCGGI